MPTASTETVPLTVAVVGATGVVGRALVRTLEERAFPVRRLEPLASRRSEGRTLEFRGEAVACRDLERFDFGGVDLAFLAAGGDLAREWAPRIVRAGARVIDNSSAFRAEPDVPLVVPEVNEDALGAIPRGIVANPNCSTAQLVLALAPLHRRAGIRRVVVSTYQSVSGAGRPAMDELRDETARALSGRPEAPRVFPAPIAFNLLPHVDRFLEDGSTREEWKMVFETKKILDPSIELFATCVRVPVLVGHGEAVTIELERPLDVEEARALLDAAPGVAVRDRREPGGYATPRDAEGRDATFVSRLRRDPTVPNGLAFWVVADNLRKGAALNAVQIAEALLRRRGRAS